MRLRLLPALLLGLLTSGTALAQQGKNGALTVTGTGQQVNAYTTLTANAAAGDNSITVAANALNTNFAANLAAGDLVLIIQMQGATITTTNGSSYGTVTNYNGAGTNEVKQVASVSGGNTISFNCGLTNAYTVAGRTQVVRMPRYSSLILAAGTAGAPVTLTAPAWGGATGGVLAVEVAGNVNIGANARFNVDGLGFRGGALNNNGALPANVPFT